MKPTLKALSLLLATAYPCLAYAEFLGARITPAADAGTLTGFFAIVLLGLIAVSDYSRRLRLAAIRRRTRPICGSECHRLAA